MELLKLPNLAWVACSDNPFLTSNTRTNIPNQDLQLTLFPSEYLNDPNEGLLLGKGASGITREYTLEDGTSVAIKEYAASITSDGNPYEERKVSLVASSLGCKSIVRVIGQTTSGSLIMELLKDYEVFAQPPSMESCSRDVYDEKKEIEGHHAISIVTNLLFALMKLHENGICHGDFYGHNILLSKSIRDDKVWLTDFGAAFFYNKESEYGALINLIERRAFKHLVNEIKTLYERSCRTNVKDNDLTLKLQNLSEKCESHSFTNLHDEWKSMTNMKS